MDFYFAELENLFLVVLAVVALAMHTILFLLGFAAIDIALVVAAIVMAVSLRH